MALHLNLYHEIHRAAERERRDPFKIAMLAGLVVVFVMTLWYFHRYATVSALQRQYMGVEATWKTVEPEMKRALDDKESILQRQKNNQRLIDHLLGRFYWGPVLQGIAEITPLNVQLISVNGETQAKDGLREVSVNFKGIAAGAQARTAAEQYRKALQEKFASAYGGAVARFDANSLEDEAETVTLNGQTLGTAAFRIQIKFSIGAASPSPTPSPAPKKIAR